MDSELDLEPAEPHIYGPTWRRKTDGNFWLPEKTLGRQLVNWAYENLRTPGGPDAGEPYLPTPEQYRFFLWWFAVNEQGRFIYRSGVLRRLKGWGKDPVAAVLSMMELCGPVQFSHFDVNGDPVGKPKFSPWIQLVAVSQDQTRNTFMLFNSITTPELKRKSGLDIHKTVIYNSEGGLIEGVTSSPTSLEGKRPTLVIENETQWWNEQNDGHFMDEVISGNVDKSSYGSARTLKICNAHVPGQDSVQERDHDTYMDVLAGDAVDTGVLYDALEAPANTPLSEIPSKKEDPEGFAEGVAALRAGLEIARGDAVWLDLDTIVMSMLDPRRPVSESRRKFLNQVNASEDSWITPMEWDACRRDVRLEPSDKITLGFDGSKSDDHSALVACRLSDGALFVLRHWNPKHFTNEEIPREQVDAAVRSAMQRYRVYGFRSDVKEFEAYVDNWTKAFGRKMKVKAAPNCPIAFDMRGQTKKFSLDCERFVDAVVEEELLHDGNPVLRQHILNARRNPTVYDTISIMKPSKGSSKKIDTAVSAVLAFGARQEYLMSKKGSRTGKGVVLT